ncbi:hypothetical protein SEPCBS119000_006174 [Sporothrix epigloea]|uniref:Uncharacterized protein n=1 Tax=Sporothrix epigloea TaxID=1892477 RepID=A0ABP0E1K1_9PEZI
MAEPQAQKRQRTDESFQSENQPLTKKAKTTSELKLGAWESWVFPPEFYNRLSEVQFTHRVFDELQRRNRSRRSHPSRPVETSLSILSGNCRHQDVARFARQGGPDLSDLRGYPYPPVESQWTVAMAATHSYNPSIEPPSLALASSQANNVVQIPPETTPIDVNFGTHLADHSIHLYDTTPPPDLDELKAAMTIPRPLLSLSNFSESDFRAFLNSVRDAGTVDELLVDVIPTLLGPKVFNYATAQNEIFDNLRPLTDGSLAAAKPHLYDGARPMMVYKSIRDYLGEIIVPWTAEGAPVVPNFFFEVGDRGGVDAARLQARYHGALGARAMHGLQNLWIEFPVYDGKAYTYSATFYEGMIQIFAHHVTAPTKEGFLPQYHMSLELPRYGKFVASEVH